LKINYYFSASTQKLTKFRHQLKKCVVFLADTVGKPLGNAQRLLSSLLAILNGYWKATGNPTQWQFPTFSLKLHVFCLDVLKVEGAVENLRNHLQISPTFSLSNK
jgi:hypothetical protein